MQHELPLESDKKPGPPPPRPRPRRAPRKPAPPPRGDMRLTAWIVAAVVAIDQLLKYWVVHVLRLDQLRNLDVLPPWLNLRMAWNQGVNFGLMASEQDLTRWILIGVAVAICAWVWIWLWRSDAGRVARIAGGLLSGGAIGNVIDRVIYGAVADFLNMSLPGWQNPYSFNIADISIFAGAIGLVLMPQKKPAAKKPARKSPGKPRGKPPARTRGADNPRDGGEKSG